MKVVRTINDFFMESILFVILGILHATQSNHNIRFIESHPNNVHLEFVVQFLANSVQSPKKPKHLKWQRVPLPHLKRKTEGNKLKTAIEKPGLIMGAISVFTFWLPPIGLFLGIAGLIVSLVRRKNRLRFGKLAIAASALGILLYVAFWGAFLIASQ